jgi:hypothetical protein
MQLLFLALLSQSVFAVAVDCNGGRYEDNLNGTVSDCRTGLIWLKNANCNDISGGIPKSDGMIWDDAQQWVAGLQNGICGLTDGSAAGDWRLPTKTEFMAMIQNAKKLHFNSPTLTDTTGTVKWTAGNPFTNVQSHYYWTSTTLSTDATKAAEVDLSDYTSSVDYSGKSNHELVWPVRAGNNGSYKSLLIH